MVKINGEHFDIAGRNLTEHLVSEGYNPKRVAVLLNGSIVPKAKYDETIFQDGDVVEIVGFVGGG